MVVRSGLAAPRAGYSGDRREPGGFSPHGGQVPHRRDAGLRGRRPGGRRPLLEARGPLRAQRDRLAPDRVSLITGLGPISGRFTVVTPDVFPAVDAPETVVMRGSFRGPRGVRVGPTSISPTSC